jgi:hypothetical protein
MVKVMSISGGKEREFVGTMRVDGVQSSNYRLNPTASEMSTKEKVVVRK